MNIEYIENYIKSLFNNDGLPDYYVKKERHENVNDPDNIKTIGYSFFMYKFKTFEYTFGKNYLLVYETALNDNIFNMFKHYYIDTEKTDHYIRFIVNDDTPIDSINMLLSALYKYSKDNIKPDHDCCHQYIECSNIGHCVTPLKEISVFCSYRKKLEKGIIFFGINRNVT